MSRTVADSYTRHVREALRELPGVGTGACLDVCCGTGPHAVRRLPVAVGDAAALPMADRSVPASVCVLARTDVPDYSAVLREVARAPTAGWSVRSSRCAPVLRRRVRGLERTATGRGRPAVRRPVPHL